ncbi:MAG TPA: response regulator [Vicinamibacterales bacterium]|nr:response regulator [Vicinamibacterales bacterium]
MASLSVLVVEDNPADVDLLLECLQPSDSTFSLHVVGDGLAALAYLREHGTTQPHVVILDLNLPGLSGYDVLSQIKDDERLRHIPVVVLTHSEAQDDVLRTHKLGANCYITKASTLQGFRNAVKQLEEFWFELVRLPIA